VDWAFNGAAMAMGHERVAKLASSWGSLRGMLPLGGAAVWGNATWAPDDHHHDRRPQQASRLSGTSSLGTMLAMDGQSLDVAAAVAEWQPAWQKALLGPDMRRFQAPMINPLAEPLPHAPSTKIYCLYGVGQPTERAHAMWRGASADGGYVFDEGPDTRTHTVSKLQHAGRAESRLPRMHAGGCGRAQQPATKRVWLVRAQRTHACAQSCCMPSMHAVAATQPRRPPPSPSLPASR
jgi:hypothetical protein